MGRSPRTPSILSSLDEIRAEARRKRKRKRCQDESSDSPRISLSYKPRVGDPDNMPVSGVRVLGPYPNGANFRLILVENGRRKSLTAPTLEAAESLKRDILGQILTKQTRTIADVLAEYIEHSVRDHDIVQRTIAELHRLTQDFLPSHVSITAVSPAEAARLYDELSRRTTPRGTPLSPSTHHVMLRRARAIFRFAVDGG